MRAGEGEDDEGGWAGDRAPGRSYRTQSEGCRGGILPDTMCLCVSSKGATEKPAAAGFPRAYCGRSENEVMSSPSNSA